MGHALLLIYDPNHAMGINARRQQRVLEVCILEMIAPILNSKWHLLNLLPSNTGPSSPSRSYNMWNLFIESHKRDTSNGLLCNVPLLPLYNKSHGAAGYSRYAKGSRDRRSMAHSTDIPSIEGGVGHHRLTTGEEGQLFLWFGSGGYCDDHYGSGHVCSSTTHKIEPFCLRGISRAFPVPFAWKSRLRRFIYLVFCGKYFT